MTATAHKPLFIIPGPDPMDTCDHSSCPASAMVRVAIQGGSLVFCGHHFDHRTPKLDSLITAVRDMRDFG